MHLQQRQRACLNERDEHHFSGEIHHMSTVKTRHTRRPALDPMEQLLEAMHEVNAGNFSIQLPVHWEGMAGKLAERFNEIVSHNRRLADDLAPVRWAGAGRPASAWFRPTGKAPGPTWSAPSPGTRRCSDCGRCRGRPTSSRPCAGSNWASSSFTNASCPCRAATCSAVAPWLSL